MGFFSNVIEHIHPTKESGLIIPTDQLADKHLFKNIEGKGIYLGMWRPVALSGVAPKVTYLAFAAPEDVRDRSNPNIADNFNDLAQEVAGLRNWHGHDGIEVRSDTELYAKLRDGSAVGKWIVPPRDLVDGIKFVRSDLRHPIKKINENNMYDNMRRGALRNSFAEKGCHDFYVTCSRDYPSTEMPELVWMVAFRPMEKSNKFFTGMWMSDDTRSVRCRPCRIEIMPEPSREHSDSTMFGRARVSLGLAA